MKKNTEKNLINLEKLRSCFNKKEIKNVLLISPPDTDKDLFNFETAKRKRYWNFPAYGLGIIARLLTGKGYNVDILNLNNSILEGVQLSTKKEYFDYNLYWKEALEKRINNFNPDIISMTCMFSQTHKSALNVTSFIKSLFPEIPISIGGVHITNSIIESETEKFIQELEENIDFFFLGEAEYSYLNFLEIVNNKLSIENLNQVYFKLDDLKVFINDKKAPTAEKINIIPQYDLLNLDQLSNNGMIGAFTCLKKDFKKAATILSNRGCRGNCTFCSVRSINGKGVRSRSIQSIIDEMLILRNEHNIDHIMWLDDDLLFSEKRASKLFEEMINQKVNLTWDCSNGVIASACSKELVSLAAKSGCIGVNIGVESGNSEKLKSTHKPSRIKDLLKAANVFKQFPEINARVFLMIGFPNETYGMMLDTYNLALEMDLDWYNITILQPLPGTAIFKDLQSEKKIEIKDSNDVRYNSGGYGKKRESMHEGEFGFIANPFENKNLFDIPTTEELEQIWFYFNYNLNFMRLLSQTKFKNLNNRYKYLEYVVKVIAPDDAYPLYFYGRLQLLIKGKVESWIIKKLDLLVEKSLDLRNNFNSLGISAKDLIKS